MNRTDRLLVCLVALIWGANFTVIEWGRGDVPALLFLAARFVLVLVPAIFLVPRPDLPWRTMLGIGALMSLGQFGFLYVGMAAGMPPGLAALVLQLQVMVTVLVAAGVLHEVPTSAQLGGVVLGLLGLLVVGLGRGGDVPLAGLALVVCGAISWGCGNVLSRASGARGGLGLTVWSALVVPVPLVALSLLVDGPGALPDAVHAFGWQAAVSTLYTAALASLLGYGIFTRLLARNTAAQVTPWIMLAPPVAMLTSWLAFGDAPTVAELLGAVLVLGGVAISTRPAQASGVPDSTYVGPGESRLRSADSMRRAV